MGYLGEVGVVLVAAVTTNGTEKNQPVLPASASDPSCSCYRSAVVRGSYRRLHMLAFSMPTLVRKETGLWHFHQHGCKDSCRHSGPHHCFQVHPCFSALLVLLRVVMAAKHCEYLVHLISLAPGQAILLFHTASTAFHLYQGLLHIEDLHSHSFGMDSHFLLQVVDHSGHLLVPQANP